MSSNGSGLDLATDDAAGRPAFSCRCSCVVSLPVVWSRAKSCPPGIPVEGDDKGRGWVEEGRGKPLQGRWKGPRTWSPSDGGPLHQLAETLARRGILAALTTGVGGELGLVPRTTAWNWGRRTVDGLPTVSGKPVVGAEGPGGGASWSGWPVTGDEPTSRPGHCQADRGGMYRCLETGILSLGGTDKALICGPIPGQASNVGKGTGSGDRPCLSIRRGQDQSPYALRDWRHWVLLYRLGMACPQQETLIRLCRGWRMIKGGLSQSSEGAEALEKSWTWFPAWNRTDPREQKKAPSSRQHPAEDKFLRSGMSWRGTWGMQGSWPQFSPSRGEFLDSVGPFILQRKDKNRSACNTYTKHQNGIQYIVQKTYTIGNEPTLPPHLP